MGESEENCKLIAYLPTTYCENVELSDVVTLRGNLQTNVAFYDEYGYRDYAVNENIKYKLTEVEACKIVGERFNLFAAIRERVSKVLYRGMDDEPAAVCLAVLTGNTSGIESGLLENIRYGGIAHIFAVSGLHIGSLFAACLFLFSKTRSINQVDHLNLFDMSISFIKFNNIIILFYLKTITSHRIFNLNRYKCFFACIAFKYDYDDAEKHFLSSNE